MPMRALLVSALLGLVAASGAAGSMVPLTDIELVSAQGEQGAPAIAAGGGGFLATWIDRRAFSTSDLRATRIDAGGQVIDRTGIVLSTREDSFGYTVGQPRIVWTGHRWMVLFGLDGGLAVAFVSPEAGLESAPREVARGNLVPAYDFDVVEAGGKLFVTGRSQRGASFLVLDLTGTLVVAPRLIDQQPSSRPITQILVASRADEVLVVTTTHQACIGCAAFVSYRFRSDGTELARTEVTNGPRPDYRRFAMSAHGDGYLVVGQLSENAKMEMWTLSADGSAITGSETIAPPVEGSAYGAFNFDAPAGGLREDVPPGGSPADGPINLVPAPGGGTDVFFFRPVPEQFAVLKRATITLGGDISSSPFPIPEATQGELRFAVSDAGALAISTTHPAEDYGNDVVARVASSIDSLPSAAAFPVTYSARAQLEARAVRRGAETLVTWVERRLYGSGGRILAQRLDPEGRPRSGVATTLLEDTPYAIASDGAEYLVAAMFEGALKVRRLRGNLTWRDPDWTTIESRVCNLLVDNGVVWDGEGWWLSWASCTAKAPVLQRFDRALRPLTRQVELRSEEPTTTIQLVPIGNSVIAFWTGDVPGCQICTCPPPTTRLFSARVSRGGFILNVPALLVDDVDDFRFEIASRGTEILAIWPSWGIINSTRITTEMQALDLVDDEYGRHGTVLDDEELYHVDAGWDGERWVAAALTFDHESGRLEQLLRRFPAAENLPSAWLGAEVRTLDSSRTVDRVVVSAAPGHDTLLIQPAGSDETTGVQRYYVRNVSAPPRTRGARR